MTLKAAPAAPITPQYPALILDACCVMNLYASHQMAPILSAMRQRVTVAAYVRQREALTVYSASTPRRKEMILWQPLLEQQVLQAVDLETGKEKATFIRLAAQGLDDGEAITLALALCRGWAMATDDGAVQRLVRAQATPVAVISTPALLKHWVDVAQPPGALVRQTLQAIEQRANDVVGRRHPLFAWWQAHGPAGGG